MRWSDPTPCPRISYIGYRIYMRRTPSERLGITARKSLFQHLCSRTAVTPVPTFASTGARWTREESQTMFFAALYCWLANYGRQLRWLCIELVARMAQSLLSVPVPLIPVRRNLHVHSQRALAASLSPKLLLSSPLPSMPIIRQYLVNAESLCIPLYWLPLIAS